jgi:putative tricarboxylic transport membrane protein
MDVWGNLFLGFQVALSPYNLLFCFLGCLFGTLIGVLPGIGPAAGISILIPLTFGLPPTTALITMSGLYYGCMYGGSTTSILVNVPGEAASVVTCLDGYQMARNGRAGAALGMAAFASFIAGTVSIALLTFTAIPLVKVAIAFGPPEYFALTFMGLTLVTSLSGESLLKGLMSGAFGLIVACVGVDAMSGYARFSYGNIYLLDGFGFVNIAVGLFAVSEVMINIEKPAAEIFTQIKPNIRTLLPNLQDWKDSFGPLWRGTLIGFIIGALPGTGPTIASFLAYSAEKNLSKHPEKFGTGIIEGVAAPEGANNAAAQGAFVPMLTLGVPGSGATAIMLGALMLHGLRPGPMLMETNPDFVWGLIASMYIGNAMLLILNLPLIGIWVQLLKLPYKALMPLIVTISAVGIYAIENNTFDLWVMVGFGVIGYILRKYDFPLAPIVLAVVLAPLVEYSLKQSMILSKGSIFIFFTRPIAAAFMILALISLFAPLFSAVWVRMRKEGEGEI